MQRADEQGGCSALRYCLIVCRLRLLRLVEWYRKQEQRDRRRARAVPPRCGRDFRGVNGQVSWRRRPWCDRPHITSEHNSMEHDPTETSGLRHRTTAHQPTPESDAAEPTARPATSSSPGGWDSQLAAARRALVDRLGPDEDPDFALAEMASAGEVCVDRRGSDASDGDAEVVRELLGTNRERPPVLDEAVENDGERRDTPAEPEPEPAPDANPADERMCRICFDGEDEELGRLFSPCQCRGTVSRARVGGSTPSVGHRADRHSTTQSRFVHVACLDRWRTASAGASECLLFALA